MLYLQIQRYFNAHIDKDIDIVVAEVDADIIGVFCVCYLYLLPGMNPDSERSAYLIFDYIKPEFRISEVREKIFEYHIEGRSFVVKPVFKDDSANTFGAILLRLMQADCERKP